MKSTAKPLLLSAAALLAVAGLALCGAFLWINSPGGRAWLLTRIDAAIPGSITVERHHIALFGPRLVLETAILQDPGGKGIAGFSQLAVTLDAWALLRRELRLDSVRLDAPWAELATDADGRLNLTRALVAPGDAPSATETSAGSGLPFNIVCRSLRVAGGHIAYTGNDEAIRLNAEGLAISADGDLDARTAQLELTLARVSIASPDIVHPPLRVDLNARLAGDALFLKALEISAGGTHLVLTGTADHLFSDPRVDAGMSLAGRLEQWQSLLGPAGYEGPVDASLTLKGRLANPDARLDIAMGQGRIADRPLARGTLTVNMADRQATVADTVLHLADGTLAMDGSVDLRNVFPQGFLEAPADVAGIGYAIGVTSDIPDLHPWLAPQMALGGSLKGRLDIAGQGVVWPSMAARLTLAADGRRLSAPGMDRPVDGRLHLSAAMDNGRVAVDRVEAAADGVHLSGSGAIDTGARTVNGDLRLTARNLSRALAVAGLTSASGTGNAALSIGGTLDRPHFTLHVDGDGLRVAPYTLGSLALDARLDPDGRLRLERLNLTNGASRIRATGRLRLLPGMDAIDPDFDNRLDLDLTTLSAADFMISPPLQGRFDGRLRLGGPRDAIEGTLALTGSALRTAAATIGNIDTRLRWNDGTLRVERLDLRNRQSTLTARGRLGLLVPGSLERIPDPMLSLQVASNHIDPKDFIEGATGAFTLDASLAGTLHHPTGTLALAGKGVEAAGQPLARIDLNARLAQDRLWLEHLAATVAPGQTVTADGWLGMDKTLSLAVDADGIAFASIAALKDRLPAKGVAALHTTVAGQMDDPDIAGHLALTGITVNDTPIHDMHLDFQLHAMQLRASGNLNAGLDAAYDLRRGDFTLDLVFDDTETAAYFRAAGLPRLHGTLSGRLRAAGNTRDVRDMAASIAISRLRLLIDQTPLVASDRIAMELAQRRLSIPAVDMALLSTGHLGLEGSADLDGQLAMTISGRIPLAAAGAFRPELADAAGTVAVDGSLSGALNAPRIEGRIDLEDLAMKVPHLEQRLHDVNGGIRFSGDTIRIEGLTGHLDTGTFRLAGTIGHDRFSPTTMDLTLSARTLPLAVPDTLSLLLNADIAVTGEGGTAAARGEIVVLEGLYYKDVKIDLLQLATTRQRSVPPASTPLTVPFFDTVDLDITVSHRQPFTVENNLAQLELRPDLHVGGTLARPVISGRAQVAEGTITFRDRTFDVTRGIVDFVNPYRTEAEIDIAGQTTIRSWTITLTIKGTPDNLDLTLSSVPSESDADILSLLLFGRTAKELSAGEGGTKRSTGQIMAELIAETFGEDIKRHTGVDILEVKENGDGVDEEPPGMTVTVGKHLSDRITVKYAVETQNGEFVQRAIAEYKLLENILVSGFQNTNGIYGSELVFRIEFR